MAADAVADSTGFVQGVITCILMDDLMATLVSMISSITLLNKFNIKGVNSLEKHTVNLGREEVCPTIFPFLSLWNGFTY